MEDTTSSLELASRLLDTGQIKDAYTTYLSAAQEALSSLSTIKFVHNISKPTQYAVILSNLRTCVTHIESIIDKHAPCIVSSPLSTGTAPPPLPPKPSRIEKPALPRRPSNARAKESQAIPFIQQHVGSVVQTRDRIKNGKSISRIVPGGHIDPTNLVLVQTETKEPVQLMIPEAPMVTQHRQLQTQLDEVQSVLANYRARHQRLVSTNGSDGVDERMTEQELSEAIQRYTPCVAETQQAINKVRAMYMSASTITSILHFQPALIAHQLTLIESGLFKQIPPDALLTHQAKHRHPRIVASIDFFNYLTRLIEHSILLPPESSVRAQHINHWIKVGIKCHEFNNYQTLKAITCALATPPIQRLRRTWAYVPKKSMTRLDNLNELMSETDNYGRYREHLDQFSCQKPKPAVPFLGMFIHDATYLLAASKDPTNDHRIQSILERMKAFQNGPEYPSTYQQRKRQPFGPVISGALQRSQSLGSSVTGVVGITTGRRSTAEDSEDRQHLATHYLLSQPWVSEAAVDQLSTMREAPSEKRLSRTSMTSGQRLSSTSSVPRFSSGSSSLPDSVDDFLGDDLSDGFWSLRGSIDSYIRSMYKDRPTQDSWTVAERQSTLP
ncbi:hypothetical protein EC973_006233 [Apophysomyces ossiformis]|uniref:Ras-GEF domain-containing protein n=1 Tax=Apophysomyces ossiformis TaxID=679940 RepID=A0A8H7EKR8_9FUNG|nr:hypothetical protein EC973_006233 [Apophysomyces ossiformis]